MQKLIQTYRSNPTPENAKALVKYHKKHPMAVCMLSITDISLIDRLVHELEAVS